METKHPGGCPPRYKTAEEMQVKIDEYFKQCEGRMLLDEEGNPVLNKFGIPIYIDRRPPTVTGLALALGFNTRLALLNYQAKEEFVNTVTRAKSKIEAYAEERLFDKDGVNGAKFSLSNNFKEWKEKQSIDAHNTNENTNLNTNLTPEQLVKMKDELLSKFKK